MGEKAGMILLVIATLIVGIFVVIGGIVPTVATKGDQVETQITNTNVQAP